ncbi:MAG: TIGR03790 family protein [Myxococcales bacterium]|nr:TIGR03790 family protein [Myxococcales bacterium]
MLSALASLCLMISSCSVAERNNVLVITNSESPISVAIGTYYAKARMIPSENVVRLKIPLRDPRLANVADETITAAQYDELIRQPLERLIEERGLRDTIEILVTTKGIPLRVDGHGPGIEDWLRTASRASLDAELSLLFSDGAGSAGVIDSINPFFDSRESFREFRTRNPDAPLHYMVARLTGYQNGLDDATGLPRDIKNLIDASTRSTDDPSTAIWLLDEDPSQDFGLAIANRIWLGATADILSAMGLKVQHDRNTEFVSGVDSIAGYASWGSNDGNDAGKPFYGLISDKRYPGTFAPRSLTNDFVSTSGRSFTYPPRYGQSLIADLVHLGVAGATGNVYEPALSGVPRPQILLPSYAEGLRAVEAFYRSIPYLGWMNIYVGDPLMTIANPRKRPPGDRDCDGVPDAVDNCIDVPNPDQRDTNADGFGNMCDADVNGDGIVTTSWGAIYPLTKRGDIEWIAMSAQNGPYDPNFDLDGDGDVDHDDLSIAHFNIFMQPGPSAQAARQKRD